MNTRRSGRHILIFEPRIEGHHLMWVQYVAEDLLSDGHRVSLILDTKDGEAEKRLAKKNPTLLNKAPVLPAFTLDGSWVGGTVFGTLRHYLEKTRAEDIFVTNLDEFASSLFRYAVLGWRPPDIIRGKLSGIYHRPRPLDMSQGGINNKIKRKGLTFLCEEEWLHTVFLVDELTLDQIPSRLFPNAYFTWIPDPCTPHSLYSKDQARARLNIPDNRIVFLSYGVGSRRKGLHLAIKAFEGLPPEKYFLLAAGDLSKDKSVLPGLNNLYQKGSAKTLNYYVSPEEEALCFSAADMVLLPYISHFGSANVLSQAAAANRPVIASDYHLLGARVKKYNLGLTFNNKSVASLREEIGRVLSWDSSTFERFIPSLEAYAKRFSRASFREHLLRSYPG